MGSQCVVSVSSEKNAAMVNFQGLVVVLTLVVAACWASSDKHPDEGLDAAGYPLNITAIYRISEGKSGSSITERRSFDCLREGRPTESCDIAGGYCVRRNSECDGIIDRRGCRGYGCRCCMPHVLPDCRPTRSCSSADGYCVKDEANCTVVVDPSGCIGAGCMCCLPSSYGLPWVYLDDEAFVPFPDDPMNWYDAQSLCRSYGLNLYHPNDIINVTEYLDENTSAQWYWLGAKGDGTSLVWFDGTNVTVSVPPCYRLQYCLDYTGTNDCLATIAYNDNWVNGTVIFSYTDTCSRRTNINPL